MTNEIEYQEGRSACCDAPVTESGFCADCKEHAVIVFDGTCNWCDKQAALNGLCYDCAAEAETDAQLAYARGK